MVLWQDTDFGEKWGSGKTGANLLGWEGYRRIHAGLIHIDLKDEKIWVQRDGTEYGVANELVDLGVPREDIVLGFQAPYKRPYTDFAVA